MKKIMFIVFIITGAIISTPAIADDSEGCRAGTAAFLAGQAGIVVNLQPAMETKKYSVSVQPTNTAGYSPVTTCTYFNVLKKTKTQFQVQHKQCADGVPVALDTNVSLDWIICSHDE